MEINKQSTTVKSSLSEAIIDQGLRAYMLKVYNYMASGVLLTGFIALLFFKMSVTTGDQGQIVGLTNFGNTIYASGLKWIIILREAGGFVDFFEEDINMPLKKNILATNSNIHDDLRGLIGKKDIE